MTWAHVVSRDAAGGLVWRPCPRGPSPLRRGGRYLITGATGALGTALARRLARALAADLVLTGRRDGSALVDEIAALGGTAVFVAADLTDAKALSTVCAAAGTVDGVFHLAGPDPAAKAGPLDALRQLDAGLWVLYSSISAVIPGLDQGIEAYAAANRALDGAARAGHARGERWVSIAWAPWDGSGLAARHANAFRARGIEPIDPATALDVLDHALGSGEPHVVVLHRPDASHSPLPSDLDAQVRRLVGDAVALAPEQVPPDVPFVRMGLDSVAALDLVRELEHVTGRHLPTTLLYEAPTVEALLRALRGGTHRSVAPPADPDGLLPAQETFAVQHAYFPDIPGNVLLACTVDPGLDREALRRALHHVTVRHPAVATAIVRQGGWRQVPGPSPELRWVDAVDLQAAHAEVFALSGPLFRVITDGRSLVLNAHHGIVDAWSLRVFALDLLHAHQAFREGRTPDLPALRAGWTEAASALAAAADPDTAWWAHRYQDGVPPVPLAWRAPVDRPTAGPVRFVREVLDRSVTAALTRRARDAGVTLPALVLASYLACLWRWSGQHDLVVRVAQGRREVRVPDVERLVGAFADSLPVRVVLDPREEVTALAARVQAELAAVQAHAASSAVALAKLGRTAAGPVGLTPVGFSFPLLPAPSEVSGLSISDVHGASASGFTRLGLIAWVFDGRLHGSWNFAESHLAPGQVRRMAAEHAGLLRRLATGSAGVEPPAPPTLHGRILARCRRHPQRPAVGDLTYGELDRRSAALAALLQGDRIGVLARPGAEAVVALLAVLRAGAAVVPLDPDWPPARLRQVLDAAAPAAVVATPDLATGDRIPTTSGATPVPDREGPLAWVMFTSGSTGRPKGVCVSHAAALSFQDWVQRMLGLTERDRFVQTSSLAFGGAIRQVYAPLLAGGQVIPAPPGLSRDPDALVAFLQRHRITIWNSVPSLWVHLMDALERTGALDPLPDVRWVLLGGEAVPAAHVRRWRARFGDRIRLANLYGATETVVNATWHEVVRDPDGVHTPIGWPRAGVDVHLLDDGEIAVTGAIAGGYLHASGGFAEVAGLGRAYRTGDLARRAPDGALVYLGRRDSQVQVHGNRVELGEIEHTLTEHAGVDHAAVVQLDDGRLHATVAGTASPEALRAWLSDRLPRYMVPHELVVAGSLPRTPAGKADRRALRAMSPLAEAWVAVLHLDRPPRPEDDFFALGGDSIALLEVLDRLRAHGDVPSPLALYARPSLAGMAAVLASPPPSPRPRESALGGVQRGFWLAHQADPDHPPTWCAEVPVRGPLDPDALREGLNWLVRRHTALRTVIRPGPVQVVLADPGPVPLPVDDLTQMAPQTLEARWREQAAARMAPDAWPAFRVRLLRLGPADHRLLIAAHHVVADAWSAWLLTAELLHAHDAIASGRSPSLPPAPALIDVLRAEPPHDPWWDRALAGLRQPPARVDAVTEARATLDGACWSALRDEARRRAVSPFALVLTALFRTLAQLVPGDDRVVCIAVAAREGAEGVVGPLARALPIRVQGPPTVDAVGAALRQAAAHSDTAASGVVAAAGSLAKLSRFFLSWLDPAAVPLPDSCLHVDHAGARVRFSSRDTELMAGAVVSDGLHVHLTGGSLVQAAAPVLERHLRGLATPECALVVYPPTGTPSPVADPLVVERVDTGLATSELVLLPVSGSVLVTHPHLFDEVDRAVRCSGARVVALGGWLPALTGLGARPLGRPDQVVTTGHAATVVAMVRTVQRLLERVDATFGDRVVGVLGYGAIGRAVLALARHVLGEPRAVLVCDPRLADSQDLATADLVLGATTGGRALEVAALRPGTLVVDDSFPRAFDDQAAIRRMTTAGDVVLVHGGMLDAGPLVRTSPYPEAEALRARHGARWLPGCHAEALLVAAFPELGPTVGVVDVPRALAMWEAVARAGWDAAPLHLGAFEIPDAVWDRCA